MSDTVATIKFECNLGLPVDSCGEHLCYGKRDRLSRVNNRSKHTANCFNPNCFNELRTSHKRWTVRFHNKRHRVWRVRAPPGKPFPHTHELSLLRLRSNAMPLSDRPRFAQAAG